MHSTKLTVAHVINGMGLGGVPPIVQQLMAPLPRDRYDLLLYCLERQHDVGSGRDARFRDFVNAGIPVRFPDAKETPLQAIARLSEWIDEDAVDVLHTHSYQPNLIARMAGLVSRRPLPRIVAHYHAFYDDRWTAEGTLPLDRQLARSSDVLVASSEAVRSHVAVRLEVPFEEIRVIPNGVDCARFGAAHDVSALRSTLGIAAGTRVIAAVGRVSRQKASDDVVRAARVVCDARQDCVFVLAGADDDPFAPAVRQLVAALGLERRVLFTGHLTDVAPLYALADVVVMPSRWEGSGRVLVEAMASGTPLVTTTVGPIPEVVGEGTALMIRPDAPGTLACAVLRLLDDPALARALAREGIARARTFSWSLAAARLDGLYGELAQEVLA